MKRDMDYRTAYKVGMRIAWSGLVPVIIGAVMAMLRLGSGGVYLALFGAGIALAILGDSILRRWCRCPQCGRRLSFRGWGTPDYCPRCGGRLDLPDPWL